MEKKNSLREEKTRMKRLITDLPLRIVMRRMKWLKTKRLTWMVKTIETMLIKMVMKTMAVLIVSTLRRFLRKKAGNLKKRMHLAWEGRKGTKINRNQTIHLKISLDFSKLERKRTRWISLKHCEARRALSVRNRFYNFFMTWNNWTLTRWFRSLKA